MSHISSPVRRSTKIRFPNCSSSLRSSGTKLVKSSKGVPNILSYLAERRRISRCCFETRKRYLWLRRPFAWTISRSSGLRVSNFQSRVPSLLSLNLARAASLLADLATRAAWRVLFCSLEACSYLISSRRCEEAYLQLSCVASMHAFCWRAGVLAARASWFDISLMIGMYNGSKRDGSSRSRCLKSRTNKDTQFRQFHPRLHRRE